MAKRKDLGIIKATPSAPEGADDLTILNPNQEIEINGVTLTVREYGFVEGLRLRSLYQPLLDDLAALLESPAAPIHQVSALLAKHVDTLIELMCKSAGVDAEFIEQLSQADGEKLKQAWWAVNCGFFLQQAKDQVITKKLAQAARDGQTFTKPSSSTTTRPSESSSTPSGK